MPAGLAPLRRQPGNRLGANPRLVRQRRRKDPTPSAYCSWLRRGLDRKSEGVSSIGESNLRPPGAVLLSGGVSSQYKQRYFVLRHFGCLTALENSLGFAPIF